MSALQVIRQYLSRAAKRRATTAWAFGIISAATLSTAARFSVAGPLRPAAVPAGTHWVMFVNSDELVKTGMAGKLSSMVSTNMRKFGPRPNKPQSKQQARVKNLWNSICKNTHDMLFYGPVIGNKAFVLQLHVYPAKFQSAADLQSKAVATAETYKGVTIRKMRPDGRGQDFYLSRPAADDVLITHTLKMMQSAIDFQRAGKSGLTSASPLFADIHPDVILYFSGTGLSALPMHAHVPPFVRNVNSVDLAVAADNARTLHLNVTIDGANAASAENMYKMMEGGLAMTQMMGQSQSASPEAKLHSMMLSTLKVARHGAVITATWPLSVDMLEQSITDHLKAMRNSRWQRWSHHQGQNQGGAPAQ